MRCLRGFGRGSSGNGARVAGWKVGLDVVGRGVGE